MNKIIVFLGPSLSLSEAQKILPTAYYLPPIQSGDILRVLRLKPDVIGIIDGYFENTAAVWHKEIIYAVEKGVSVIAGGSMGALRASELSSFGLTPVGEIAALYLTKKINDDDEVAILHSTKNFGYNSSTEAMINIRATLSLAFKNQIIDKKTFHIISKTAKKIFYQERTLACVLKLACQKGADIKQVAILENWLKEPENYQDVKKKDAILVLETIAKINHKKNNVFIKVNRPAFFRALQKNVMCRPFSSYQHWLPIQEKTALAARYLGSTYRLTRRLAYLLSACYFMAKQKNITSKNTEIISLIDSNELGLNRIFENSSWEKLNDCTGNEKIDFINRMSTIVALLRKEQKLLDIPGTYKDYLFLLLRLSGNYFALKKSCQEKDIAARESYMLNKFKETEPKKYQLMLCIAYCWWFIERNALRLGLQPDIEALQDYSDSFRRGNGLQTTDKIQAWLNDNDLDSDGYHYLMAANFRLKFLVFENNLDILNNLIDDTNNWWLLDALWLSGVYTEAKELVYDPLKLEQLKNEIKNQVANLNEYALSLDFIGGEQEFMNDTIIVTEIQDATSALT